MTNCVNCGAPINLNGRVCPYCDTPYRIATTTFDRCDIDFNYKAILMAIGGNCITVNEARRIAGLEEVYK